MIRTTLLFALAALISLVANPAFARATVFINAKLLPITAEPLET